MALLAHEKFHTTFALYYSFTLESPRWYFVTKQFAKAKNVIQSIVRWNRTEFPNELWLQLEKNYQANVSSIQLTFTNTYIYYKVVFYNHAIEFHCIVLLIDTNYCIYTPGSVPIGYNTFRTLLKTNPYPTSNGVRSVYLKSYAPRYPQQGHHPPPLKSLFATAPRLALVPLPRRLVHLPLT